MTPRYRAARLCGLRGLGRYGSLFDPRTKVLPRAYGPGRHRPAPHIYHHRSGAMADARHRAPGTELVASSCHDDEDIIGLLWCTGLRIGEAVCRVIATSILALARSVSLHASSAATDPSDSPSVVRALERYQRRRRQLYPRSEHLFVSHSGKGGMSLRTNIEFLFHWLASPLKSKGDLESVRLHDSGTPSPPTGRAVEPTGCAAPASPGASDPLTSATTSSATPFGMFRPNRRALRHAATTFQNYRQRRDEPNFDPCPPHSPSSSSSSSAHCTPSAT